MTDLCNDCEWMRLDNQMRRRCHSPPLQKLRVPGMMVNFELDDLPEPDRSHESGTGKCGPTRINYKKREAV